MPRTSHRKGRRLRRGRLTSWTDRNGTTYWYAYDESGRVVATGCTGEALAYALTYEDATRTTRVTDPLGHVTSQEWDQDLRLTALVDPLGHTTRYQYDERGRVVSVTRPDGLGTTATYNELGLPATVTGEDGAQWRRE
ncbi:hypothetical protein OG788_33045 [Streptomyces sp. NBC_00647]|uniref:hypothetical protein n=1 Tax=Streptomyces sp. NBC_00647 TaxID=2975796 RepID=UPI003247EC70